MRVSVFLALACVAAAARAEDSYESEFERRLHKLVGYSDRDGFFLGRRASWQVRLRAVLQADGRAYFAQTPPIPDTFVIRRARPILEATFGDAFDLKIVPDFGLGQVVLFDAYVDVHPWSWLALHGGKFKTPFGLERLEDDRNVVFQERGLPSDLAPDRDVGAYLHGDIAGGALLYYLGVVNGTPDGASVDSDTNDGKDYVARLFAHPFRPLRVAWLENFGVGVAGTYGKQHGNVNTTGLAPLKTAGQNVFFSWLVDTTGTKANAIALGDRYRVSAQLYWYASRFGLLAEYVRSTTNVSTFGDPAAPIVNQAWEVEAMCVLTGERDAYDGIVPKHPFKLGRRDFGAVDVGARYGELRIDPAAFPRYADPTKSARAALAWGITANWYLTWQVKFGLLFERTTFTGGNGKGDRTPENALIGRLQLAF
jgi:phosphate-selective porin OprO/OprP